jgi:murein L,D-transpeptidase YafK
LRRFKRLSRLLMASAVLGGALSLAGCETDEVSVAGARALRPVPVALAEEMDKKNMPKESPILLRIFKEEAELEVWKQNADGQYALLKTYPICRWSGELGPKIKEGDRQAPEGFYQITPGQMNPNSNYYLAFDLGFPNTYDRANDRTGAFLMVHGDCSSRGCYAMTDEQIQEIYAMGRDSFLGGQKSFQVQAYPFRMTPLNMAKHRNSPNMAFWRMIKEGNDHFLVSKAEPRVDVCEKHYVFDASAPNASRPLIFHAREKCPTYETAPELAQAAKEKEEADERAYAELVNRGVDTVPVRTGTDGGMHPAFEAKLHPSLFNLASMNSDVKAPPGPLPSTARLPRSPSEAAAALAASPDPTTTQTAGASDSETTMQKMGRWFGFGGNDSSAPAPVPAATAKPKPKPATTQTASAPPAHAAPASKPAKPAEVAQANSAAAPRTQAASAAQPPAQTAAPAAAQPAAAKPAASPFDSAPAVMVGAAPVVQSGGFAGRWDAVR